MSSGATRVRPWFLRLIDWTPLSAAQAAGILAGALLVGNFALWRFAHETIPSRFPSELLLIFPIMIFYMLAMGSLCVRGALHDLASLRPHIACSDREFARLEHAMTHYPRRLVTIGSLAGIAVAVLLGLLGGQGTIQAGSPLLLPVALQSLLFWTVAVPTCLIIFASASTFGRIGRERLCLDLFDRRPFQAFVRVGLRVALVLLGVIGLRAAFYSFSAPAPLVLANLGPMIAVVALAAGSLLLPLWGVRTRILAAKAVELERVYGEIARRRAEGAPIDPDEGVPRSLINLLDYLAKVEAVSEWPFDAPALVRFAAYLLIPIGGWIGGALMDQLIEVLMR